jgi:hypothetical protein
MPSPEQGENMALSRARMPPNPNLIHKYLIDRRILERVLLFHEMVRPLRRILPRQRMNSTMSPTNWLDLKRIMLFEKSTTTIKCAALHSPVARES